MQCTTKTLLRLSGALWVAIGVMLMTLGIRFLMNTTSLKSGFSLVNTFPLDRTNSALFLVVIALFVGYLKGKFVLAKSAKRQITRISSIEMPQIQNLFSKGYLLLIGLMMCLGMGMRFLPITLDTRGVIDLAIGAALINGSMHYFRACR